APGDEGPTGPGGGHDEFTGPTVDPRVSAANSCPAPNPGHVVIHRLNRTEYNNTIRDLLGDTSRPADEFPADDGSGGVDNNSAVLTVNSDLLGYYEGAAQRLAQKSLPKLLTCNPTAAADQKTCAARVLGPFAQRAWRRPVTMPEINELATFVVDGVAAGN